jgi:flagellar biogenesis protein FliO
MLAAGIVDLFVRMVTSLAIVLAIVAVAYVVMRRRAGMSVRTTRPGRTGRPSTSHQRAGRAVRAPRAARRPHRASVEVIGRVGLSRSTAAVAVKFGDRVLLVGASEQAAPTVLAEIDAATWELCPADAEWSVPTQVAELPDAEPVSRPTFLDALREATVRRA